MIETYFSALHRKKSLEKGKLVFQHIIVDRIWIFMSILILSAIFIFGCHLLYVSIIEGLYWLFIPILLFPILAFVGLFVPSTLKKVELQNHNRVLVKEYFTNEKYKFVVKKDAMLVVRPQHRLLSLHSPSMIVIIFDRRDVYINCSTFYSMFKIYARMRFVTFFFFDRKHENKLVEDLNQYIKSQKKLLDKKL